MVLEKGKIIEFDRYGQQVSGSNDEKTNSSLCPQTCHLVERSYLQILFVVQSNRNRGIRNIKKFSRSLIYTCPSLVSPTHISNFKFLLCFKKPFPAGIFIIFPGSKEERKHVILIGKDHMSLRKLRT